MPVETALLALSIFLIPVGTKVVGGDMLCPPSLKVPVYFIELVSGRDQRVPHFTRRNPEEGRF